MLGSDRENTLLKDSDMLSYLIFCPPHSVYITSFNTLTILSLLCTQECCKNIFII